MVHPLRPRHSPAGVGAFDFRPFAPICVGLHPATPISHPFRTRLLTLFKTISPLPSAQLPFTTHLTPYPITTARPKCAHLSTCFDSSTQISIAHSIRDSAHKGRRANVKRILFLISRRTLRVANLEIKRALRVINQVLRIALESSKRRFSSGPSDITSRCLTRREGRCVDASDVRWRTHRA